MASTHVKNKRIDFPGGRDGLAVLSVLEWYLETGITQPMGNHPAGWVSSSLPHQDSNASDAEPDQKTKPKNGQLSGPQMVDLAKRNADIAQDLVALQQTIEEFEGCPLKLTASKTVFSDGNPSSKIMIVGEAPGREEDLAGKPFVGRSGQLLDRMLAAIRLDRKQVYITNVIPWRPPGNRTPTPLETQMCLPFILRHIQLIDPQILVLLGGAALKVLTGADQGILRARGRWRDIQVGEKKYLCLPTLHPAYLLRQPAQKRLAWHDLLSIQDKMGELALT